MLKRTKRSPASVARVMKNVGTGTIPGGIFWESMLQIPRSNNLAKYIVSVANWKFYLCVVADCLYIRYKVVFGSKRESACLYDFH